MTVDWSTARGSWPDGRVPRCTLRRAHSAPAIAADRPRDRARRGNARSGARRFGQPRVRIRPGRRARRTSPTSSSASTLRAPAESPTGSRLSPTSRRIRVRTEVTGVGLETADEFADNGAVEIVGQGRRGYAIVAGRDVSGPGPGRGRKGLADAWHLALGGTLDIDGLGTERIVGLSESPDNVSYPLASPRVYVSQRGIGPLAANFAEIWLRDPRQPERGARPGARDQLRPARPAVRHAFGGPRAARPGGRDRDRPARGAVADRARHRERDARRVRARRGPAPARGDRRQRAVGASRAHLAAHPGVRGAVRRGAGCDASARSAERSRPTVRPAGCSCCSTSPLPGRRCWPALAAAWLASVAIPVLAAAWPAWRAAGRRRWRCSAARSSRTASRRLPTPAGRTHAARRAARRRPPDPAGRHRGRARLLDRVRAAAARARLRTQRRSRPTRRRSASATS